MKTRAKTKIEFRTEATSEIEAEFKNKAAIAVQTTTKFGFGASRFADNRKCAGDF